MAATRAHRGHLRLVEPSGAERPEGSDERSSSVPDVERISAAPERISVAPDSAASSPLPQRVAHSFAAEAQADEVIAPASSPAGETGDIETPLPAPPRRAQRPALRGPLANLPDAQLVALGCKGDGAAFELLYRRHVSFALHLATRIEGSSRDVEDIVHDAFLRAFERINDLSDRGAFKSWLGAIVVHAVRSRMRRHRLMNLLGIGRKSEPVDLDSLTSPDASPHTRAQIAQIYALLRTLPSDDRISWTLRCVEGHDLDSVAKLTRCSLATVKRRISRAQQFLDEHFIDSAKESVS
jgi:RNA polymerase sigma-70 factor, ECF subfamily